jgi:hypothetical protein
MRRTIASRDSTARRSGSGQPLHGPRGPRQRRDRVDRSARVATVGRIRRHRRGGRAAPRALTRAVQSHTSPHSPTAVGSFAVVPVMGVPDGSPVAGSGPSFVVDPVVPSTYAGLSAVHAGGPTSENTSRARTRIVWAQRVTATCIVAQSATCRTHSFCNPISNSSSPATLTSCRSSIRRCSSATRRCSLSLAATHGRLIAHASSGGVAWASVSTTSSPRSRRSSHGRVSPPGRWEAPSACRAPLRRSSNRASASAKDANAP